MVLQHVRPERDRVAILRDEAAIAEEDSRRLFARTDAGLHGWGGGHPCVVRRAMRALVRDRMREHKRCCCGEQRPKTHGTSMLDVRCPGSNILDATVIPSA